MQLIPTPGRRASRRSGLLVAAVLGLVAVACGGPAQPLTGLGAQGPCTKQATSYPDPKQSGQTINIYLPDGTATPPTGGTCNDANRPVAIVVHGLLAGNPSLYDGIITHLVTTGNIVIFATYNTDTSDFVGSFQHEDDAIVAATTHITRGDLNRIGVIGHSMGGGAIPFIVQHIDQHGWGTTGLWAMSLAPWQIQGVPAGAITFPSKALVVVEAYSDDTLVQKSVGIDMFNRITTPLSKKQHVTLRTATHGSTTLSAQHTTPNSIIAPDDAMKFFGIYRIADALQSCSLLNQSCDTDFSYMGTWPDDNTPVLPAISTDTPS